MQRLRLAIADLFGDVVVTHFAQAFLRAEVMNDQCRAHARGLGDGAQPDGEAVLGELLDRRIADPGGGGQVG